MVTNSTLDAGAIWPGALEHAGDGRFPHCHRPRHPDDEGSRARGCAQEGVGDGRQLMASLDVQVQEPGEWEKAVLDHVDVEIDVDSPDLLDVRLGERRGVLALAAHSSLVKSR